ncbi:MAG: DnaJ domain-containing protein [Bryobacterales bacterium]|nr:DnaJ domain-containing protein [Bryobacterales bacterium]
MATDHRRTAHEVLGLNKDATQTDIRAAYIRLAKKYHPDKNLGDKVSEWVFREIQEAYECLRDSNETYSSGNKSEASNENSKKRTHDRSTRHANRGTRTSRQDYYRAKNRRKGSPSGRHSRQKSKKVRSDCRECGTFASEPTRFPQVLRLYFSVGEILAVVLTRTVFRLLLILSFVTFIVFSFSDAWITFLESTSLSAEVSTIGTIVKIAAITAILLIIGCFLKVHYEVWNSMALPLASFTFVVAIEEHSIGLGVVAGLLIVPFSVSVLRTYWTKGCPPRCENCDRILFEKSHNHKHKH